MSSPTHKHLLESETTVKADTVYKQYKSKKKAHTPIVIDSGSFECRAGFAVKFAPLVGKLRGQSAMIVGNDLVTDDYLRTNPKSGFEKDVIVNFELQEHIFDYIFSKLGVDTSSVNHPIVVTEPICNPPSLRKCMTELLFECYQIPSLQYGVDALFSRRMMPDCKSNGLIVRSGFFSTHVIPIWNNTMDARHTKRLTMGGWDATDFMIKSMQLKHPRLRPYTTVPRAQALKEKYTYTSLNYKEEAQKLSTDKEYFAEQTVHVQLPFVPAPKKAEKSQEEVAALKQKRKQHGENLRQKMIQRNEEKKQEQEQQLKELEDMLELHTKDSAAFEQSCKDYGYESIYEVKETIKFLKKKTKSKRKATDAESENSPSKKQKVEAQDGTIQAVPTSTTTTEAPAIVPPATTEPIKIDIPKMSPEEMEKTLRKTKLKRTHLMHQIEQKIRKQQIQKAKQQQQQSVGSSKTRKKTVESKKKLKAMVNADADQDEDTFGMDDDDWNIYSIMNGEDPEVIESTTTLSEDERELGRVDVTIQTLEQDLYGSTSHIMTKLHRHATPSITEPDFYMKPFRQLMLPEFQKNMQEEEWYQMDFTMERIRLPELAFQPFMIGMENAGITELLDIVLKYYPNMSERLELVKQVYCCGGNTHYPQFAQRIELELKSMLPVDSIIHVQQEVSVLDAWRGASLVAQDDSYWNSSITSKLYSEYGADAFVDNDYSNRIFK